MGTALGPGYEVVVDAMSGRTTDSQDPLAPQIPGVGTNGNECLPATLGAHLPLELVVLTLGANDCKPQFARSALRIALGAGRLIETVQRSANFFDTLWLSNPAPWVLLVCPCSPAPLSAPTAWRSRSPMSRRRLTSRFSMPGRSSSAMASMACI